MDPYHQQKIKELEERIEQLEKHSHPPVEIYTRKELDDKFTRVTELERLIFKHKQRLDLIWEKLTRIMQRIK